MRLSFQSCAVCLILFSCTDKATEQKQVSLEMNLLKIPSTGYINFRLVNHTDQDLSFSVEGFVKDTTWHSFNYNLLSVEQWKPKNAEEAHLTINYGLNKKAERNFSIPASAFPGSPGFRKDSFQLQVHYFFRDPGQMLTEKGPAFSIYPENSN